MNIKAVPTGQETLRVLKGNHRSWVADFTIILQKLPDLQSFKLCSFTHMQFFLKKSRPTEIVTFFKGARLFLAEIETQEKKWWKNTAGR